jgi:SAM-dependent methyltransferase
MEYLFTILNKKIFFPLRYSYLIKVLIPLLKDSHNVLDLGSSDGKLARLIKNKINIKILGVDTNVLSKTYIPVIKYNGKRLPFKNNSFDCVMIIDVLHHEEDIEKLLKESKRVTKKFIIIKDHYYTNPIDFKILKIIDYSGNKPYNINLPYKFLKLNEFEKIFKNNNLKIVYFKKFRYNFLHPVKHVIYKLQK